MKKLLPVLLSACLAGFAAEAKPAPPEYLAIGYPGQIYNLAEAGNVEVRAYDGDSRELVYAKQFRVQKVDAVSEVLDVVNSAEIRFGTNQPLRVVEIVVEIFGNRSDPGTLFIASDSLLVASEFSAVPTPGGMHFQHVGPADLDLQPGRFPLRLKEFQKAYQLSGRTWETAYEAEVVKQLTLVAPPAPAFSAFAIEQGDQTFLYDMVSGELKIVRDGRLDPDILDYGTAPRIRVRDFASAGPYRYSIADLNFQFADFQVYPSTEDPVDFTYESGDLAYGPPIFTFAESTGTARIRVRETRWNQTPDFVWYTTLDRIRRNQGFEVVPYQDREGGMELPAPAGETVFYWFQMRRKLLPPLPPPPPPSSL